jgi:MarR family transcriptional regulator, organic hydroperoxide resistance regulator
MDQFEGTDPVVFGVFQAFKRTMHLQRQLMTRMLAEKGAEGLHPAQAGCLHVLGHHDGVSQRDLADRLQLARPTVTTMLQAMEKAGLIVRRVDANDQRLTRVYLTDDGHGLTERMRSVFGRYMDEAVASLSEEDRRTLMRLLGTISDGLASALDSMTPVGGTEAPVGTASTTRGPDTHTSRRHPYP